MKVLRPVLAVVAIALIGALVPAAVDAKQRGKRDVLVVSNNWAGTADVIDPQTFERLEPAERDPGPRGADRRDHVRPATSSRYFLADPPG